MSLLKNINTFEVRNDMVAGFSRHHFFLNLWETWLKVVSHKGLSFFLILFAFSHDHLQNVFLVID